MHTVFSYHASGPMEQMRTEHWELLAKAGWVLMSHMCVKTGDPKKAHWAYLEVGEELAIESWAEVTGLDPYHPGCGCGCGSGSPFHFTEYGNDEPMFLYESVEHRDVAWAIADEEQSRGTYGEDYLSWEVEHWHKCLVDYAPSSRRTVAVKNDGSDRYEWYKRMLDSGEFDADDRHVVKFEDGSFEVWHSDPESLRYWLSLLKRLEIYEQAKAS